MVMDGYDIYGEWINDYEDAILQRQEEEYDE